MRIIAGSARGRRLQAPKGDAIRPTLERVKEGLFSAVQFWLPGASVLELFAGSGQLGLEAVSRGAARCTFVDSEPEAVALISQNAKAAGLVGQCRVLRSDANTFLAHCTERFDLVLLDPPYYGGALEGLLERVAGVCAPEALVLCESEDEATLPAQADNLTLEKRYRYGTVLLSRYRLSYELLVEGQGQRAPRAAFPAKGKGNRPAAPYGQQYHPEV